MRYGLSRKKTENEFGFIQKDEQKEVNDKLIIHLNCPGGQVSYAFLIADVIKSLEIPVYCIGEGSIASAGIVLLLACENGQLFLIVPFIFMKQFILLNN